MSKFPKRTINKIYKIIKLEAKKKNSNKKIGKRLKVINKFLLKILNMKIQKKERMKIKKSNLWELSSTKDQVL